MTGIVSYGAYIPFYRLERSDIAEAWDFPSAPGEIAVANSDEDSITMAVEAGLDCIQDIDEESIDALYFATTTAPYTEKQSSSVIAGAFDLREDVSTVDFTDSLSAGSEAVKGAINAIESGEAEKILIVSADCRLAPPQTMNELQLGDGAAAFLMGQEDVIAEFEGSYTLTDEFTGPWRRNTDRYVQHFDTRHERKVGYVGNVKKAVEGFMEETNSEPGDFSKVAIYSPDPRRHMKLATSLGFEDEQIHDPLFLWVGDAGTPLTLMMTVGILEEANEEEKVLAVSYGDGSEALCFETTEEIENTEKKSLQKNLEMKEKLPDYPHYLKLKEEKIEKEKIRRKSSPVKYWRDRKFLLNFYGMRCNNCGTLQYPIQRVCIQCGAKDDWEEEKLSKRGEIFTYTLDHLVAEQYLETPVPRAVLTLDGGCRVFLEVTDCDPEKIEVGMPVKLTFRKVHEGGDFKNYYWKCKPIREAD